MIFARTREDRMIPPTTAKPTPSCTQVAGSGSAGVFVPKGGAGGVVRMIGPSDGVKGWFAASGGSAGSNGTELSTGSEASARGCSASATAGIVVGQGAAMAAGALATETGARGASLRAGALGAVMRCTALRT